MRKAQGAILHQYYVYIYLDPRRAGKYKYDDLEFDFLPFYVGKGKRNRYKQHIFQKNLHENSHKNSILKKILNEGFDPLDFVLIYEDGITEEKALAIEREIISKIGCTFLKNGPLSNKTTGGEFPKTINKGLTYEEIYGEERAKILKKNRSERFSGKKNPMYGKESRLKGIPLSEKMKRILSDKNSKSVYQLDKSGNIIAEYRSAIEAGEKTGFSWSAISNVLSPNYHSRTSNGFIWIHKDRFDKMSKIEKEELIKKANSKKDTCSKPVQQIDKKTKTLIKTWKSISEAAMSLFGRKTTIGDISTAAKRNGSSHGFLWKLVDNKDNEE